MTVEVERGGFVVVHPAPELRTALVAEVERCRALPPENVDALDAAEAGAALLTIGSGALLIGPPPVELSTDFQDARERSAKARARRNVGRCDPAAYELARYFLDPLVRRRREKLLRGKATKPQRDWVKLATLLCAAYPVPAEHRKIRLSPEQIEALVRALRLFAESERPIGLRGVQSYRAVQMFLETMHIAKRTWQHSSSHDGSDHITVPVPTDVADLVPADELRIGVNAAIDIPHHAAQRLALAFADTLADPSLALTLDGDVWRDAAGRPVALIFPPGTDFGLIAERLAGRATEPFDALPLAEADASLTPIRG